MYSEEAINESKEGKEKKGNGLLVTSLIINILLATGGGYLYYQNQQINNELIDYAFKVNDLTQSVFELEHQLNMTQVQLEYYKDLTDYYSTLTSSSSNSTGIIGKVDMPILAVQTKKTFFDAEYQGHVLHSELELQEGQGRILVNTEVINGADIQTSVRTASQVVEKLLGISFSNTDIILTITGTDQLEAIDGPSAGGAITVAIMAALENKQIKDDVYMTGTINSDGTIGSVGGIPYKAIAAAENGAQYLLVPLGQGNVVLYEPKTVKIGRLSYTTYEKIFVELEEYLLDKGFTVNVIEVTSIMEAYEIFTNQSG